MLNSQHRSVRWAGFILLVSFLAGVAYPSTTPLGKLFVASIVGAGMYRTILQLFGITQEGGSLMYRAFRVGLITLRIILLTLFLTLIAPVAQGGYVEPLLGIGFGVLIFCVVHRGLDFLRAKHHLTY